MAVLAESLVDEWLNRQGFFTVRGMRHGVNEIDLLGVRPNAQGLEAWHVEVQVSFRPVGYISSIPRDAVQGFSKSSRSAKTRTPDLLRSAVAGWIEKKFTGPVKCRAREGAWPGLAWKYVFVHAVVRTQLELDLIAGHGVEVKPFNDVLSELGQATGRFRGGAGTDLSEIIEYFYQQRRAAGSNNQ